MDYIAIENIEDFDVIKELWDDDAFVRECYILHPGYIALDRKSMVSPVNFTNLIFTIFFGHKSPAYPDVEGVEIFLGEVESVNFDFRYNYEPNIKRYACSFFDIELVGQFRAKQIKYRFLSKDDLGDRMLYGHPELYLNKDFFPND